MARSSKKNHPKKTPAKKSAPKKRAAPRKGRVAARKNTVRKPKATKAVAARKPAKGKRPTKLSAKLHPARARVVNSRNGSETLAIIGNNVKQKERRLDPFIRAQKERLLQLRDAMVDSMAGVAQDTLRARAEGSEASAFGMHQADAGSDAYDRDFALSLLSQEQDALYEIDQALKRIELGTYGI